MPSSLSCVSFQQQKRSLTERQHYKNGSKDGCLRANLEAQQTIPAHNLKKISFSGYDPIPELFGTHVDDVDVFREPVEDSTDRGRVEEGHWTPQDPIQKLLVHQLEQKLCQVSEIRTEEKLSLSNKVH